MWVAERKTLSRGRSVEPEIFLRMRNLRRVLPVRTDPMTSSLLAFGLSGLARLAPDCFAAIADALAAIWLWGAEIANRSCDLTEQRIVGRSQHEQRALRVRRHVAADARRQLDLSRVRVAERQRHRLALDVTAIAGADQLEQALEALGHAAHLAGQERS